MKLSNDHLITVMIIMSEQELKDYQLAAIHGYKLYSSHDLVKIEQSSLWNRIFHMRSLALDLNTYLLSRYLAPLEV